MAGFCAVGTGTGGAATVVWSADGVTWQAAATPPTAALRCVAHDGSQWVTVEEGGGRVWTSPTADVWTDSGVDALAYVRDVGYADGRYMAAGVDAAATPAIAWSTDLTTWHEVTVPAGTVDGAHYLTYHGGIWWFTSFYGINAAWSTDGGTTWTARGAPWHADRPLLRGVGVSGALHFAGSADEIHHTTTADPATWTATFTSPAISPRALAHADGVYVAVGQYGGNAATSPDATTWTNHTTSLRGLDVTYDAGLGLFALAGQDGAATSPDGATWTDRWTTTGDLWAIGSEYVAPALDDGGVFLGLGV